LSAEYTRQIADEKTRSVVMNLDKLIGVGCAICFVMALSVKLYRFTWKVHLAKLKLLKASQTSTWGSPRIFDGKN